MYKMIQAVQENGPNYWLIYHGVKVFGATPIARCETEAEARYLVNAMNAPYETVSTETAYGRTVTYPFFLKIF